MQSNTADERELVRTCMVELCKKMGFSDSQKLVQRDIEFLCASIESQTRVLISMSTMKRLLNGQFSRLPQVATLNAIANFLGYPHWQAFKMRQITEEKSITPAVYKATPKRGNRFLVTKVFFFGILLLIIVASVAFFKRENSGVRNGNKAEFSAYKMTNNDIPNSVLFKYNIDAVDADSFFIQQSWDKNRKVRISKKKYTLTDIYYEPGYHTAKLIANDEIIKTQDVSIPTDRWFLYAKGKTTNNKPEYIRSDNLIANGLFGLTEADLTKNGIVPEKEITYLYTYFPSKIEVSSDNCILKAKLRMKSVVSNFCPYIMIEIFCQKYFMYFKDTPKGCSSELNMQFGENFISGKQTDLSLLGYDVTTWMDAELTIKNKQVNIKINGAQVFSTKYENSGGLITGLGFISNGLCEIDAVELKGLNGKVVYQNDFNSGN